MKFEDVIKNIKVGETYKCTDCECGIRYVKKDIEGIKFGYSYTYRSNGIPNGAEFELERKEYDFKEAFDALKDGYTIQSVSSGIIYYMRGRFLEIVTKYEDSTTYYTDSENLFTYREINGKWYVLD